MAIFTKIEKDCIDKALITRREVFENSLTRKHLEEDTKLAFQAEMELIDHLRKYLTRLHSH